MINPLIIDSLVNPPHFHIITKRSIANTRYKRRQTFFYRLPHQSKIFTWIPVNLIFSKQVCHESILKGNANSVVCTVAMYSVDSFIIFTRNVMKRLQSYVCVRLFTAAIWLITPAAAKMLHCVAYKCFTFQLHQTSCHHVKF